MATETGRIILGIESSCDETAASIYQDGVGIRSSELFSQIEIQKEFGGVMPEVAARSHLEKIKPIIQLALDAAGVTLAEVDAIAVTNRPGLPGSLLVGLCYAKAIAWSLNKPLIAVNHLEGHIFSACIEHDVPFPHLCLTASGGHTALYLVRGFGDFELIGQTDDDAAGEAFDKVAKMIGLPYPGGPEIEKLAQVAGFEDFFNYPRGRKETLNFSFSGLKTAVLYDLVDKGVLSLQDKKIRPTGTLTPEIQQQVSSSLLVCIKDIFIKKLKLALKHHPDVRAVTFVGGVACNKFLKNQIREWCEKRDLDFYTPSGKYCTDNAAMIALVGNYKAQQKLFANRDIDIFENPEQKY